MKIKNTYQFICRIGHYPLHFNFHFFLIVDFKEQDGEVFYSFSTVVFGVGAVQVFL